mgnify:CR=1 FL=1
MEYIYLSNQIKSINDTQNWAKKIFGHCTWETEPRRDQSYFFSF